MNEVYVTFNIIPCWAISTMALGVSWVVFVAVYFTFFNKGKI